MSLLRKTVPILLCLLWPGVVWSQSALRDPTTPPAGFGLPPTAIEGGANPAGARPESGPAVAPAVQIMVIGPARKHVVINGQTLRPGEKMDQWRLVSITAQGVVLQNANGSQTIPAHPPVKKKVISAESTETLLKNAKP